MEIKAAAKKFREYWNSRSGYEKGEDQQFWNSLLRDVLGAEDIESSIKYQVPVKLKNTTKFLDAWIPSPSTPAFDLRLRLQLSFSF